MKDTSQDIRKITVNLPADLVERTLAHTDQNLTQIIREALQLYNHRRACQALLDLRGKADFRHYAEHCDLKLAQPL